MRILISILFFIICSCRISYPVDGNYIGKNGNVTIKDSLVVIHFNEIEYSNHPIYKERYNVLMVGLISKDSGKKNYLQLKDYGIDSLYDAVHFMDINDSTLFVVDIPDRSDIVHIVCLDENFEPVREICLRDPYEDKMFSCKAEISRDPAFSYLLFFGRSGGFTVCLDKRWGQKVFISGALKVEVESNGVYKIAFKKGNQKLALQFGKQRYVFFRNK